jgi:glycosyltransferase involved in cell wall biosynthesis
MSNKLVIAMLAGNCENTIDMALESVKDADETIIVYDTTSKDDTYKKIDNFMVNREKGVTVVLDRAYDHSLENKYANSEARNFYLNYLKANHKGAWCLVLDADEVVEELEAIKIWIDKYGENLQEEFPCFSVKMRHFIGNLGHEDSTVPEHFVLNRLFKIDDDLFYPKGEHPVLNHKTKEPRYGPVRATTIWHLGYVPNLNYYKERYDTHMAKSEIHNKQFLGQWYMAHLLGQYPNTPVNPTDVPEIIWNHYGIDKDMFYFSNRGVEVKHFAMAKQWRDYFDDDDKIFDVIEFGCGRAPYGAGFEHLDDVEYKGVELSQFAVNNRFVSNVVQGDITSYKDNNKYKLVMAVDVLEHLTDAQLHLALDNIKEHSRKYILFSIPFIGDPNLMNDKTHKQFREKEEWKKLIEEHGIKIEDAPTDWLFSNQLLIGVVK